MISVVQDPHGSIRHPGWVGIRDLGAESWPEAGLFRAELKLGKA